jgi:hypothetical protein
MMEAMDLSGIASIILQEYQTHPGIFFENHVYGCLSLLETRLDSSAVIDVSDNWSSIGSQNGFYKVDACLFEGSLAYQDVWRQLFRMDVSAAFVDDLEDLLIDAFGQSQFFSEGVDNGDLSKELEGVADALMPKAKRRLAKSRKGARLGTPPKTKLRFDKTRRRCSTT